MPRKFKGISLAHIRQLPVLNARFHFFIESGSIFFSIGYHKGHLVRAEPNKFIFLVLVRCTIDRWIARGTIVSLSLSPVDYWLAARRPIAVQLAHSGRYVLIPQEDHYGS